MSVPADLPYLYLTSTGWKSGSPHRIEIWFVAYNGAFYIVAERRERSHWVQNIRHNPSVTFEVGDQTYTGIGRLIDNAAEPDLAAAVSKLMDDKYGWSSGLIVELKPA